MKEENWALRRASLTAVESILLARESPRGYYLGTGAGIIPEIDPKLGIVDATILRTILEAVKTGAGDAKHAKVRAAAYTALEAALLRIKLSMATDAKLATLLSDVAREEIRMVMRKASAETEADLIRKASALQALWLEVNSLISRT